jgi:hypothetical protein
MYIAGGGVDTYSLGMMVDGPAGTVGIMPVPSAGFGMGDVEDGTYSAGGGVGMLFSGVPDGPVGAVEMMPVSSAGFGTTTMGDAVAWVVVSSFGGDDVSCDGLDCCPGTSPDGILNAWTISSGDGMSSGCPLRI